MQNIEVDDEAYVLLMYGKDLHNMTLNEYLFYLLELDEKLNAKKEKQKPKIPER